MSRLKMGDKAPQFALIDQHGNTFQSADYLGKKKLVVFFYPKDFTPGCTAETKSFCFNYGEFGNYGCEVVGISADSTESHRKFGEKLGVPFPLLTDLRNSVRKQFGVPNTAIFIPGRETFLIDERGVIIYHIASQFNAEKHVTDMITFLEQRQANPTR